MQFLFGYRGMDFTSLLETVSDDAPSGIELRNDSRFHAIERLLEPAARESRLNDDGTLNQSAPDVDWSDVLNQAMELAAEGRDLRLLVIIVRAAAATEDFEGLAQGLDLLTQSIEGFWDSLHPDLRDRDDAKVAALPRINALKQLENDDNGLLGDLKFSILLNMRGLGAIAGLDLAEAALSDFEFLSRAPSGLNEAEKAALAEGHTQKVNRVNAACRALAAEQTEQAAATIAAIASCEQAIEALCTQFAESGDFSGEQALLLPELSEFLTQVRTTFEAGVSAMSDEGTDPAADHEAAAGADGSGSGQTAVSGNGAAGSVPGAINSRRDVERSLDAIIGFYERTEPSSPIPHLARRMRRMVSMDFLELMEEIAPSGLKEFSSVAGVEVKKK